MIETFHSSVPSVMLEEGIHDLPYSSVRVNLTPFNTDSPVGYHIYDIGNTLLSMGERDKVIRELLGYNPKDVMFYDHQQTRDISNLQRTLIERGEIFLPALEGVVDQLSIEEQRREYAVALTSGTVEMSHAAISFSTLAPYIKGCLTTEETETGRSKSYDMFLRLSDLLDAPILTFCDDSEQAVVEAMKVSKQLSKQGRGFAVYLIDNNNKKPTTREDGIKVIKSLGEK